MALIDLNDPKMEFFNFGLEQKLEHHSCVEFHSDSEGNGFNLSKPQINPLSAPKNDIFQLWARKKLDHHFSVEFHGE